MLEGTGDMKGSDAAFHGALEMEEKGKNTQSLRVETNQKKKKYIYIFITLKFIPTKSSLKHS